MLGSSLTPDETGYDAKLMAIAAEIVDDTMRGRHGPLGREADVRSVFKAMQAHATACALPDSFASLASCRVLGRAMVAAKKATRR